MEQNLLKKYAELVVKIGVNIQKNQTLVVSSPIECADFVREISEEAYKCGARDVEVRWKDDKLSRIKYLNAPEEIFEEFPEWQKEFYISYARGGAAFLSIAASDPEALKGVDPDRMVKAEKATDAAIKEYVERMMSDKNSWCVVSMPTKKWAQKVFPNVSEEEAVKKLGEAIAKTIRLNEEDPVSAWMKHKDNMIKNAEFLNKYKFKYLKYKNSLGTDLKIELPEGHMWLAASSKTPEGIEFIPNMPTEEVFTLPKKTGVDGKVVSSKPLNYNGNLIDNFSITFKAGRIVDYAAEKGYENLKSMIETDEGSHYLGEVALVPYDSPISNSNILFYNTLFDENASCHLAIGKAYPTCIKDGSDMSKEELEALGVNDSITHVDFMVGTSDLSIVGVTESGEEVTVFKDGNFNI
ncbi:aminopeptidase [Clostridium guangxiense]|uniref:aminopeptidase n=1 Tax=Clostridium guangxiense TaxID=1662055 RepID=UPI001E2FB912|nr:aminopeptidase [Clostridium guangxiense]MCD2346729.1 aminopeptidase [Clostridium guangxiense]